MLTRSAAPCKAPFSVVVHAIVAYLRSLPPVRHSLPKWIPVRVAEPPMEPPRAPATPSELTTRKGRGAYLVHIARCVHCHSPRPATVRPLSRAMLWFEFRKLTDDDLGAIFEFLRSVPPVRHRVNNADPPTYCPRCGRRHGLGELTLPKVGGSPS